ncbi:hypothetical protein [Ornithinimicrobium kibberense]|uniref:hypothetical protein n=1 Tax=Ornithinimicrobium kibberense TaxID=282060 RepID=UPI003619DCE0
MTSVAARPVVPAAVLPDLVVRVMGPACAARCAPRKRRTVGVDGRRPGDGAVDVGRLRWRGWRVSRRGGGRGRRHCRTTTSCATG